MKVISVCHFVFVFVFLFLFMYVYMKIGVDMNVQNLLFIYHPLNY